MEKVLSRDYTDEEMLEALRLFYKENNRSPKMIDFKGKLPSCDMISKRFGKWTNALKIAGLEKALRHNELTDEYLLNCMIEYHNKTGKIPTIRGMKSEGYSTAHAYIKHFGSFKNALIKTGLFELRKDKHQFCDTYSDEEMLENLKNYMKNKDKIPVHSVIANELRNPSISAYERRFYSIFEALKLIGYDYEQQKENDLIELEKDMIIKYKELNSILGRVPSSRDIDKYSKQGFGYAMKTYETHFGSLSQLQKLCGFIPTVVGRSKSRQDLLDDLIMMADELGKTPSQLDVTHFENVASYATYSNEFGSWVNAIKEAGLKQISKIYYSIKGTQCLSYYELLFTNMLEEFDIDYQKEEMYNKYIETERRFRFDHVICLKGKRYFVEIFGMTDNKDYENRIVHKKQLCKENNLPLIEIYPKDFTSYKLDDIHKMLEEKIKFLHN